VKLKRVIQKLERQQRELNKILTMLNEIDKFGVSRADHTMSVGQFDKRLVKNALLQADGNQSEAARLLKISRDRLRYKIVKYRLNRK
jgi:DNA-binding protein Fis